MATRTWLGGGDNNWFTAAYWRLTGVQNTSNSPVPVPGDVLTIGTGTVTMSGTQARLLGRTGIYDYETVNFGNGAAAAAPTLLLRDKAGIGSHFDIATSGAAGYGTIKASGPAASYAKITLKATAGTFTLDGTAGQLSLLRGGSVTADAGQTLALAGQIVDGASISVRGGSTLLNNGTVTVYDKLEVQATATLGGTGTFLLGLGSTVTLSTTVPSTQTFQFAAVDGDLVIDPAKFHGVVQNFTAGNLIDLQGITGATGATLAADGTLTVTNGSGTLATLSNIGGTAGTLRVRDNGAGGTQVSFAGAGTRASYEVKAGAIALDADKVAASLFAPGNTPTAGQAITGKGVKIGIASTGFDLRGDALANAQAGYLPYDTATDSLGVTILKEDPNSTRDDAGQAMAQLVHAIAPDAQIFFYSADTPGGLAEAVAALAAAGCTVVVDDISTPGQPIFQVPTNATTAAVTATVQGFVDNGGHYFTAAGNESNAYLQTDYTPFRTLLRGLTNLGQLQVQKWSNGTQYEPITIFGGADASITLSWAAPWPTNADAPELLKMVLYDNNANVIATATQDRSGGYKIPSATIKLPVTVANTQYRFAVYQTGSTAPAAFEVKLPGTGLRGGFGAAGYFEDGASGTGAGEGAGQKLVYGANVVGAAPAENTPNFGSSGWGEDFSDGGPGKLYYAPDGTAYSTPRSANKVNFTAPDNINTTAPGSFAPFDGTAAAAAQAAAVAALMLQANPNLTNRQITRLLANTASDLGLLPAQQGMGLVDAYAAVQAAIAFGVAPTVTGVTTTPGAGTLSAGVTVTFAVAMSKQVAVTGGTPTLTLNDGGSATYAGGSGTGTLLFTHTVLPGQSTADLAVTGVSLNGAVVKDLAGAAADLSAAAVNPAGTLAVAASHAATAVSATQSAVPLRAGATIGFAVTTGVPVRVLGGTPALTLSNGGSASYTGQDGSGRLLFSMVVAAGQDTADLKVTGLALNGATISGPAPSGGLDTPAFNAVGSTVDALAAADVNGDGSVDLVTPSGSNVVVLLNDGTGGFANHATFTAGVTVLGVTAADVNGDGLADIVTSANGRVSVLLNRGANSFGDFVDYAAGTNAGAVAVADLNGDGRADIVTANYNGNGTVSVLLGTGNGAFRSQTTYAVGSAPRAVAVADIDGDGLPDIVTANGDGTASVLLGVTSGGFAAQATYAAGASPRSLAVADVNGDGRPDLVVGQGGSGTAVAVLLNNGNGGFATPTSFEAGVPPFSVTVADMNGDGKLDIAAVPDGGAGAGSASVLLGDGSGSFGTGTTYAAGDSPRLLAVADVTGDGKPDLLSGSNSASGSIALLRNGTVLDLGPFNGPGVAIVPGSDTGLAVDTTAPTLAALAATSSAAGPLGVGGSVSFVVTPSEAVAVSTAGGSPTLALNDGASASYTGQDGSGGLLFSATVAAGQDTADLRVTGLALNGATVADAAGNPLDATGVSSLAGSDTGLAVDTTAPTVASLTATPSAAGPLAAGRTVSFVAALSEAVSVNGAPTLTLNDGASASYTGQDSGGRLLFSSTVAAGQDAADLRVTGLALNGATVADAAGNPLDASGVAQLAGSDTGLVVDTTAPTLSALTATPSVAGPFAAGRTVSFAVVASEAVAVSTAGGTPTLALSNGATASYTGQDSGGRLLFSAMLAAGQDTADLKVTGLALNGAAVADAAGNPLDASGVPSLAGSDTGLVVDTTAPTVASLAATPSVAGPLAAGRTVSFALAPSEAVAVSTAGGSPTLALNDGSSASYTGQDSNGDLLFSATVAAGQDTADLKVTGLALNGAIADAAGNPLDVSDLAQLSGSDTGLAVDTTAPTVASLTASPSVAGPLGIGDSFSFTVKLSEAVTVSTAGGSPTLALSNGATASYTGQDSRGRLLFSSTVAAGQDTADLRVTGLALSGATVADAAGNPLDASGVPTLAGSNTGLDADATAPTLASLAATPSVAGPLAAGRTVSFVVTPSEAVSVNGTPALILALNDGGSASYTGQDGSGRLLFSSTVAAGQDTADLRVTGLVLSGGNITDLVGNPLDASDLAQLAGSDTGLVVDTAAPTLAALSATPSAAGPLGIGDSFRFAVTPSEAVTVSTAGGSPTLALSNGGSASYTGQDSGGRLLFSSTVAAGQDTADLKVSSLALNGAAIADTAGNPLDASDLAQLSGSDTGLAVDTTAPTLAALAATPSAAGPLAAGRTVSFALTPSEAVAVSTAGGSPTLALNDGGSAAYTGQDSGGRLLFSAMVAAGQDTADLKVTGLALNGAAVADAAGNTLDASGLAQLAGSDTGLVIDTTAPTVVSPAIVTVAENSPATAIGIAAPTDPNHAAAQLAITVDALPSNGSVTLANGTAVAVGQALTAAQLAGLLFTPTPGQFGTRSSFGYAVADPAGNSSTGSATLAIGPNAPAALALAPASDSGVPHDNRTNVARPVVTGLGTIGDTVTLLDDAAPLGTALVAADGTWSVTPATALADGAHTLTATATDAAGNTSAASAVLPLTIDTTVPAAPGTLALAPASDSGIPSDGTTRDAFPTLTGTAEAGSTVTVIDTHGARPDILGTTLADSTGAWSFRPASALADGLHRLAVTATDAAGNTSPPSPFLELTIDTATAAPGNLALAPASDSGTLGDHLTRDATPTLTGTAEAGSTVTLTDTRGGTAAVLGTALADDLGRWSFTPGTALADGAHSITATGVNVAGSATPASAAFALTIDTVAPSLATAVVTPNADEFMAGDSITLVLAATEALMVKDGTPRLALNDGSFATFDAAASTPTSLAFTYTPPGPSTGDLAITGLNLNGAALTDAAGNPATLGSAVVNRPDMPQARPAYHPFGALVASNPNPDAVMTVDAAVRADIPGTYSHLGIGRILADGITYEVTGTAAQVNKALAGVLLTPARGAGANAGLNATIRDRSGSATSRLSNTGKLGSTLDATAPGDVVQAGLGPDTLTAGGTGNVLVGGPGQDLLIGSPAGSTLLGGTGSSVFISRGGSTRIEGGGARDTVSAAAGDVTVVSAVGGTTLIGLGDGPALVNGQGADTIVGGSGAAVIGAAAGSLVGLGSGPATVSAAQGSTVVGGAGNAVVGVRDAGVLFFAGSGVSTFIGGAGSSTVVGGVGSETLFGGVGGGTFAGGAGGNNIIVGGEQASTIIGGGDGDVLFAMGSGGTIIQAGPGNETLQGGASSGADTFFAGSGDNLIGLGSGEDAVFAGTGAATVVAGTGRDVFAFANGRAGGSESIIGFKAGTDVLSLQGYADGEAGRALASATVTSGTETEAGRTTLTLSDNTRITFLGIEGVNATMFG